jgi:two-component system, NtrC family, response regulator HydG
MRRELSKCRNAKRDLETGRTMRQRPMNDRQRPTVLVVDDEVDTCQNLADILSDLDYQVDTALNGQAALDLIHRRSYDVALLDLKMPGMDGLTLYRRVRKISPSTAAVIVTAYASDRTTQDALSAGAAQVLSKPVDLTALLPLVDELAHEPLVLVVDDDEALCESLWDVLRERKLRVAIAHSETQAIKSLDEQSYQVVLLDLKLPGGDGRNLLKVLRDGHPEIRTVMITGHPEEFGDFISTAQTLGADAVCCKPFDLNSLLATIERLTRRDGAGA